MKHNQLLIMPATPGCDKIPEKIKKNIDWCFLSVQVAKEGGVNILRAN